MRRWSRRVVEDEAGAGEGCISPTLDVVYYLEPARASASVHDLRGRFPVRLLPVFSSTDFSVGIIGPGRFD